MTKNDFLLDITANRNRLLLDTEYQNSILIDLIDMGLLYSKIYQEVISSEKFSNMMLQMAICKVNSILELSKGIKFNSPGVENHIIDVQSLSAVFRSLLENYCYFNHLFIQNWTNEEFSILYGLWKISSLNQRFDLISLNASKPSKDDKKKIESEKKFVKNLIANIHKTQLYNKNRKVIDNSIKLRKWQLTIQNDKLKSISWKDLFANTNKISRSKRREYQMLSLDTHPTYFAVFQFGSLYTDRYDQKRKNTLLYQTIEILCAYLFDFETLLPELNKVTKTNYSYFLIHLLGKNHE